MAPVAPVGRDAAIKLVLTGNIPIWFGSPHPHTAIVEQDGVLRIRQLLVDPEEERVAREESIARGEGWMPEQYYGLGKPTGMIYAEARTRDELAATMKTMTWPNDW
jgi:hypothetical protein